MQIQLGPLLVLIELLLADFIFLIYQKRRKLFLLRLLGCGTLSTVYLIFWSSHYYIEFEMISYFFLFLITLFSIFYCFQLSIWDCLYWGIAGIIVQHGAYSICSIFWTIEGTYMGSFTYLYLVYGITYICEYFFITRKYKGVHPSNGNYSSLIVISALVILTTIFLNSFRSHHATGSDFALNIIVSVYSLVCCVFALVLQLGLYEQLRLQHELNIVNHLWHNDQKQFEASQQNIELLNLYCHDLKHLTHALEQKNNIDDLHTEVSHALKLFDSTITTNNHALDVILTEKSLYCEQYQITLTCMADGKQLDHIKTTDLYSMFGNLINNAIEAVVKIDNPNKRIISLIICRKKDILHIHIENYFTNQLQFVNGLPRSCKKETAFHGYGLKSVKLMVEKYHGNMILEATDDIFYVNIIIPVLT